MLFLDYFLILALGQGFILAFFLLTSKYYKSSANTWLALAMITLSTTSILDIIGQNTPTDSLLLEFFINDLELSLLIYIPLYFYFRIITINITPSLKNDFYLFLPFLIDTIINIFLVNTYSIEEIVTSNEILIFYEVEGIFSLAYNMFLCYKSYRLIRAHKDESTKKDWIFKIWQSTFVLILLWTVVVVSSLSASNEILTIVTILYLIVSGWIFWLIYNGVVNLNLLEDRKGISLKLKNKIRIQDDDTFEEVQSFPASKRITQSKDTEKTNPKQEILQKHFGKINTLMQEEHLYRNHDLGIEDIAQRMGISAGYISQIIKNTTDKSFPTWINEFRVSEVKHMLLSEEFSNYTTLAIGLEAGFKSKSAFYATFKKVTGLTPSHFKQIREDKRKPLDKV